MNKSFYIPGLDGWRAISIMAVIVFHASYFYFYKDGLFPDIYTHYYFKLGSYGVHIFFGISGFLITSRMLEEETANGHLSLRSFYIRRAFSILPIFFTYLAFIFIVGLWQPVRVPLQEYLSCLFFFRNYVNLDSWYLAHFWSLSFEEHFYIFWPLLFTFIPKKRFIQIVLAFIAIVTAWRMVEYRYGFLTPYFNDVSPRARTDLFLDYILWGTLSAYVYMRQDLRELAKKYIPPWSWSISLILFIVIYFIKFPFMDTLRAMLIQVMLLGTALHPDSKWARPWESAPLVFIGHHSYALYIWQQFFMARRSYILPDFTWAQMLPFNISFVFLMAYLSHKYIELPMIKLGKRFAKT